METTVDYKLGKISSDIETLKKAHELDKQIRDQNHEKIDNIDKTLVKVVQKFEDSILRWDSWKDGQTVYMHKTTKDVSDLNSKVDLHITDFKTRIEPLQKDFDERKKIKEDNKKEWTKLKWGAVGVFVLGVATGTFDHIGTFIKFLISKLTI